MSFPGGVDPVCDKGFDGRRSLTSCTAMFPVRENEVTPVEVSEDGGSLEGRSVVSDGRTQRLTKGRNGSGRRAGKEGVHN